MNQGWKSFFHSNLFTAVVMFFLSQAVIVGIPFCMRTSQLSEWKGGVDATLKRMDEQGTVHSHYEILQLNKQVTKNETRIDRMEDVSARFKVMEYENRRLTDDVEKLKNEKR